MIKKWLLATVAILVCSIQVFAQSESGEADDPCGNRQTTFDGQTLFLPKGFRPFYFKFSPTCFEYGVGYGFWVLPEFGTTDTFWITAQEPMMYFNEMHAVGLLKTDSLFYLPDSMRKPFNDNDFTTLHSVNHLMKGILYYTVDFDTISVGGRCTGTGYYFLEWQPVGKPFLLSKITQRDSYYAWKSTIKPWMFHCDNDIAQFGLFREPKSGDMIQVLKSEKNPKGLEVRYKIKGKEPWIDVSPMNPWYPTSINPFFIQTNGHKKLEKIFPSENQFIYLDNCWLVPGDSKHPYRVYSRVSN